MGSTLETVLSALNLVDSGQKYESQKVVDGYGTFCKPILYPLWCGSYLS